MIVTRTRLATYLYTASFPTTKQQLIRAAESNNAPRDIINTLGMLRDGEYENVEDVAEEVELLESYPSDDL